MTQANMRLSLINGTAFVDFGVSNVLTNCLGCTLIIKDSSSNAIVGYIKAAGSGETYGSELLPDPNMDSTDHFYAASCTLTILTSGCYSGGNGKCLQVTLTSAYGGAFEAFSTSSGMLLKTSTYAEKGTETSFLTFFVYDDSNTEITDVNIYDYSQLPSSWTQFALYCTPDGAGSGTVSHAVFQGATTGQTSLFDTSSTKQVLTPSSNGVLVVSTPGGSTYNWNYINPSFNYNDSSGYTYTLGHPANLSESNTASDTISRLARFGRADSETNVASDAVTCQVAFGRGNTESNPASDSVSRLGVFGRSDSESNSASDAIARSAGFQRADGESNPASDAIARSQGLSRGGTESNPTSDAIARQVSFGRGPSESNPASDAVSRLGIFGRTDAETNVASDAIARSAAYSAEAVMSESNTASDVLGRQVSFGRGNTESNPASDLVSRLGAFGRGEVENPIVHGMVLNWDPSGTVVVPGTTDVGYNIYRGTSPGGESGTPLNDSPVAVDCASFSACTYTDLTADVPYQSYYYTVEAVITEGGQLASSPSNEAWATIPAGASDVLASNQGLGRSASESNTTADSLDRLAGFRRADSETNPASDLIARLGIYRRGVPEMFAFNDVLVFVKHGKVIVLPRHEFVLPGQTRSGTVPGEVKTGEEPGRVKTGTAPVH